MALFHQHISQICLFFLCLSLANVNGKPLNPSRDLPLGSKVGDNLGDYDEYMAQDGGQQYLYDAAADEPPLGDELYKLAQPNGLTDVKPLGSDKYSPANKESFYSDLSGRSGYAADYRLRDKDVMEKASLIPLRPVEEKTIHASSFKLLEKKNEMDSDGEYEKKVEVHETALPPLEKEDGIDSEGEYEKKVEVHETALPLSEKEDKMNSDKEQKKKGDIHESVDNEMKKALPAKKSQRIEELKSTPEQSQSSKLPNDIISPPPQLGAAAKNTKRGVLRNRIGNKTGKSFDNRIGTKEESLRGLAEPSEVVLGGEMANETLKKEVEMTRTSELLGLSNNAAPVEDALNETVPNGIIPKQEDTKTSEQHTGNAVVTQPQHSASVAGQLQNVTSGDNSNGLEKELDSNKQTVAMSVSSDTTLNKDSNTSGVNTDLDTPVNNSALVKPDGDLDTVSPVKPDTPVTVTNSSMAMNPSKGEDEAQPPSQPTNNTASLAPEKNGAASQPAAPKAPTTSPAIVAAATSLPKVPSVSQEIKPVPPQTAEKISSDSTTRKTTTLSTTTSQKIPIIKGDDSDIIIDQPAESIQNERFNSQQPYQGGEFVEEGLSMVHSTPVNDQDSHFFAYFASLLITAAIGYVVYHNRNKILALVLEGRRGRGYSGSRRGSTAGSIGRRRGRGGGGGGGAKYQPLHTSLDQVMSSNGTENGGGTGLDRIY